MSIGLKLLEQGEVMDQEQHLSKVMHNIRELVRIGLTLNPTDELSVNMSEPTFGEDEIMESIDSLVRQNVTMGTKVEQFEEDFAKYIGSKHAIMVNSGSTANLLMMAAVTNPDYPSMLKPGDEVIVPALTWGTTLWPVIQMGCIPVLVDCDASLNMDVDEVSKAVTTKTRAIFMAHILGNAANVDAIRSIAIENDLLFLEDACESLGTEFEGQKAGTFGNMGSFSFYFSHNITTIEGGMIVTDDDKTADLLRCLRAHGWTRHLKDKSIEYEYPEIDPRFLFCNVGYSVRPTEIQGAFGIHQLKKLDGFNARRKEVSSKLRNGLKDIVTLVDDNEGHTWFGFSIIVSGGCEGLRTHLKKNWIDTRAIIAGNLAKHPVMAKFNHKAGDLPVAQYMMDNGFYLTTMLTDSQIDRIIRCIKEFMCEH